MIRFLNMLFGHIKLIRRNEPFGIWRQNKDGKYFCDGDCQSWNIGICTCGLYHALKIRPDFYDILDWDNVTHRRYHATINHLTFNRLEVNEFCNHGVHINTVCEDCVVQINKFIESLFKDEE